MRGDAWGLGPGVAHEELEPGALLRFHAVADGHRLHLSPEMMTWEAVCRVGLALAEVETSTSYGTPALKVRGKLIARLKEDGESVVVRVADLDAKEALLGIHEGTLFTTPHYDGHPYVLVRLLSAKAPLVRELLRDAYLAVAPKKLALALSQPGRTKKTGV